MAIARTQLPERRPIEHLAGDLFMARARLRWCRARIADRDREEAVSDLQRHMAAVDEAQRHFHAEELRLRAGGAPSLSRDERSRALSLARRRVWFEEHTPPHRCGCYRCEDARAAAPAIVVGPRDVVSFPVLLGAAHVEVRVRIDGEYLGGVDLDTNVRLSPIQLLAHAVRMGRRSMLDDMARTAIEETTRAA